MVHIQLRKHVLVIDHADYTAPIRQHEVDHTDHEYTVYAQKYLDNEL